MSYFEIFCLKIVGHSVLFFITVGKTAKHVQENFGAFSQLAGVPFCFSLHFVIDFVCRVRPTRERVCPRSAGSREGNNCPREPILNNGNADGTHIRARWRDGRRQLDIYRERERARERKEQLFFVYLWILIGLFVWHLNLSSCRYSAW